MVNNSTLAHRSTDVSLSGYLSHDKNEPKMRRSRGSTGSLKSNGKMSTRENSSVKGSGAPQDPLVARWSTVTRSGINRRSSGGEASLRSRNICKCLTRAGEPAILTARTGTCHFLPRSIHCCRVPACRLVASTTTLWLKTRTLVGVRTRKHPGRFRPAACCSSTCLGCWKRASFAARSHLSRLPSSS